jgi:hypothetical protein
MRDIPAPSIYLRNRFNVRGSHCTQFLAGKELLLRSTQKHWKLLAGCGNRGLTLGQNLPEPTLHLMQVWELDGWSALYDAMYELSEAKWYRALGETLLSENQQLLVNFASGYGISQRKPWQSDSVPGYRYVYEELLLSRSTTMHAYLRDLNWFAAELSRWGFVRTWCAREVTGSPGKMCLLWLVPEQVDVNACYDLVASSPRSSARYSSMMHTVAELSRELLLPMYTERLDERIRAGEQGPIVNLGPSPAAPSLSSDRNKGEFNGRIYASS